MSLAEKWEEYRKKEELSPYFAAHIIACMRHAFYAGAEAALKESEGEGLEGFSAQAEIDQFRRKA